MGTIDRNVFGSHEIAYECLADVERTERFRKAITEVVKPGDRVLELGTGTGILAIMAAAAGAAHVDAYEISRPTADIARTNIQANSFDEIINVLEHDVVRTTFTSDMRGSYDVLVAEMVTTGLIEEQLIPALNNVIKHEILARDARCVPRAQITNVEVVDCDFTWFGYRMPTAQIEQTWQDRKVRNALTPATVVSEIDFENAVSAGRAIDAVVRAEVIARALVDGDANAIRLSGESRLSTRTVSGWTQCMNSPVVIPIAERSVTAGEVLRGVLEYEMGGELGTVGWDWS